MLSVVPDYAEARYDRLQARLARVCGQLSTAEEPLGFSGGVFQTVPLTHSATMVVDSKVCPPLLSVPQYCCCFVEQG